MTVEILDHLKSLHTNAIDARNGYDEALRDAEGNGLTALFQKMISIHTDNASELAAELAKAGAVPGDDGSFMTVIHRTIMSIRSLFGGLGESVVPGLIDGEKRNVSSYRDALALIDITPHIRNLLLTQCERLETAISSMQDIKQ